MTKPRVPSLRTSMAIIAAQLPRVLELLLAGRRPRSASADKIARHREQHPDCAKSCCAGRRKAAPVTVPVSAARPPPTGSLRGKTPSQQTSQRQVTARVTGNPSPPRSPSLPEQQEKTKLGGAKRPKAAKPGGPLPKFGSFWRKDCTAAGVLSVLKWPDVKT